MIIESLLDTDLYKLTIQQFIWSQYRNVDVEYAFHNRDKTMTFTQEAFDVLKHNVHQMQDLALTAEEYVWLRDNHPYLKPAYLDFLSKYRFNSNEVDLQLVDGQLQIKITGKWERTVLWEVPLMALISEIYFSLCDINWIHSPGDQDALALNKAAALQNAGCIFTDFGTRRRRNKQTQNIVVGAMRDNKNFTGTSNPRLAMDNCTKAIGTMAHEVVCGISALESMNHPNRYAMHKWQQVYGQDLSVFLPDTYGIDSFFKDFDNSQIGQWAGLRHDSGCPFEFTNKVVDHYKRYGRDPMKYKIIFSDSLDTEKAIKLHNYCKQKIQCSFGIGTFFTNDFKKADGTKSKPMNMVIKLVKCNGVNVCKLSQNPEKAMGDPDAIRIMRHIHFGDKL